jgi:flavin-dependent dehydrogenase
VANHSTRALKVGVVGGGPAGSLFALYALHCGVQLRRPVLVTVFESRDFRQSGVRGCNMCAGILPGRVLKELGELGLQIPPALVMAEIDSYVLHTASGRLRVTMTDREAQVVAVFRGNGPGPSPPPEPVSFDGFLLTEAERRGARIVRQRVEEVSLQPLRWVRTRQDVYLCDLLVLACGVNAIPPSIRGGAYVPPRTETMTQGEVLAGPAEVEACLGSAVHVLLPRTLPVVFGTLVPKGAFVSVSLLGPGVGPGTLREFLALEGVRQVLPSGRALICGCRPRIAVSAAQHPFADGFVAVGDAGVTRLYKNGVGTALATARQAAETAVLRGIEEAEFRRHYAPLCERIHRDNRFGRLLFSAAGVLLRNRLFSTPTASGARSFASGRGGRDSGGRSAGTRRSLRWSAGSRSSVPGARPTRWSS